MLRDVSTEAAQAFLHYLYAADTILTPSWAPDSRLWPIRTAVLSTYFSVFDSNRQDYLLMAHERSGLSPLPVPFNSSRPVVTLNRVY